MNKKPEKKNPGTKTSTNRTREEAPRRPDLLCRLTMDCEESLHCMAGMNCMDAATPCDALYYPPILDYQKAEKRLEDKIMALFGHLEPEDMAEQKVKREEGFDALEKIAIQAAQDLLDDVGRPLCRRDVLEAMDAAVLDRIRAFKNSHNRNTLLASWLLALVLCRRILTEATIPGCLVERDPGDGTGPETPGKQPA